MYRDSGLANTIPWGLRRSWASTTRMSSISEDYENSEKGRWIRPGREADRIQRGWAHGLKALGFAKPNALARSGRYSRSRTYKKPNGPNAFFPRGRKESAVFAAWRNLAGSKAVAGVRVWTPHWTPERPRRGSTVCKSLKALVGPPGFEPGTSCTPSKKYQSLTDSAH